MKRFILIVIAKNVASILMGKFGVNIVEIVEKIRQLSEDWRQEAFYCEMMKEKDKNKHYDVRAEVWDLASEYLLNFAADLESEYIN